MSQAEQPLISHLVELRTRLLRSISAVFAGGLKIPLIADHSFWLKPVGVLDVQL